MDWPQGAIAIVLQNPLAWYSSGPVPLNVSHDCFLTLHVQVCLRGLGVLGVQHRCWTVPRALQGGAAGGRQRIRRRLRAGLPLCRCPDVHCCEALHLANMVQEICINMHCHCWWLAFAGWAGRSKAVHPGSTPSCSSTALCTAELICCHNGAAGSVQTARSSAPAGDQDGAAAAAAAQEGGFASVAAAEPQTVRSRRRRHGDKFGPACSGRRDIPASSAVSPAASTCSNRARWQ